MSAAVEASPLAGLIRPGALAAIAAGALRIVSTFIPYQAESVGLEALYGVIDLGLMFGLVAVYAAVAGRVGTIGLFGFAVALAGVASIVGPDGEMFGVAFYRVGALVFVAGLALLAAAMLRSGALRMPALVWLGTFGASLAAIAWPPAFMAAGLLLGAGYVLAGVGLMRTRSAHRHVKAQLRNA